MVWRCLRELVFGIGQFFQFVQIVVKDIFDRGVGWFLGTQRTLASGFEPFGGVFLGKSEQAQAGVVGLFLEDFSAENGFGHRGAGRTDFPGIDSA